MSMNENLETPAEVKAQCDAFRATFSQLRSEIGKVMVGQQAVVDAVLVSLFAGGNVLLEGVPGLGKTLLVRTLATTLHLPFSRIQFTPDLMPADVIGTNIVSENPETGHRSFEFQKGPIFAQVVLADEINRATPKTQSALLEAMQEHSVTVAGETHELNEPFLVLATQNPIEQEGTYPLPEAQLDRFIVQIDVPYPDRDTERDILMATTGTGEAQATRVFSPEDLMAAQRLVRQMPVGEAVVELILDLVRACRPEEPGASDLVRENVGWGPGPRAAQALMLTVRARALLEGRLVPSLEDVAAMATPVLTHRMALTFAARARGLELNDVISQVTEVVTRSEAAA